MLYVTPIRAAIFANSPFPVATFLNGKKRVTFALKIGETSEMFLVNTFCRTEIFTPIVTGLPGNKRLILMSELKLFLK